MLRSDLRRGETAKALIRVRDALRFEDLEEIALSSQWGFLWNVEDWIGAFEGCKAVRSLHGGGPAMTSLFRVYGKSYAPKPVATDSPRTPPALFPNLVSLVFVEVDLAGYGVADALLPWLREQRAGGLTELGIRDCKIYERHANAVREIFPDFDFQCLRYMG
ncbi:hypothetical protein BV25DRAFT_1835913 [Artomyces pyxidatus]|uniref:Uncharacterized protein n=1 Tax=Artomyces pyxidatus TaxID=48021 RepID=A0ACB8TCE1_9AGAM|nr:hypothetical protein BV25DRAFT_1835913 [Artomyces pyxidatus]